jgi:hypothetical protein
MTLKDSLYNSDRGRNPKTHYLSFLYLSIFVNIYEMPLKKQNKKKQKQKNNRPSRPRVRTIIKMVKKVKIATPKYNNFLLHPMSAQASVPRGTYNQAGNLISVFELANALTLNPTDGVEADTIAVAVNDAIGIAGTGGAINFFAQMQIAPNMFDKMSQYLPALLEGGLIDTESGLFDRIRRRRMRFIYTPKVSTAISGELVMWIDYGSSSGVVAAHAEEPNPGELSRVASADVVKIVKSIQRQQHCVRVPLSKPAVLEWRPQDPSDKNWTNSPSYFKTSTDTAKNHWLNIAVLYADPTTTLTAGVITANGLFDGTGAQ